MSVNDLRELSIGELQNKIIDLKKELMDSRFSLATSQLEDTSVFKKIKKGVVVKYKKRRIGDIAQVYSDNSKLKRLLKWKPKFNNLSKIVKSCIVWEKKISKNEKL